MGETLVFGNLEGYNAGVGSLFGSGSASDLNDRASCDMMELLLSEPRFIKLSSRLLSKLIKSSLLVSTCWIVVMMVMYLFLSDIFLILMHVILSLNPC